MANGEEVEGEEQDVSWAFPSPVKLTPGQYLKAYALSLAIGVISSALRGVYWGVTIWTGLLTLAVLLPGGR